MKVKIFTFDETADGRTGAENQMNALMKRVWVKHILQTSASLAGGTLFTHTTISIFYDQKIKGKKKKGFQG